MEERYIECQKEWRRGTAYGKDGGRAILSVGEDGGSMAVYNKGDKHVLQAGETGGTGLIMTLDKNGYRTGSLP